MKNDNFEVKNEEVQKQLKGIGELIGKTLPKGWGFNLMIFDFNTTKGSMFYISNGKREDVRKMMMEFLTKSKEGDD